MSDSKKKLFDVSIDDIKGSFQPKITQVKDSIKSGVSNFTKGLNETASSLGENALGVTSLGATLQGTYNMNRYKADESEAQRMLDEVTAREPGKYQESDALINLKGELKDVEGREPGAFDNKYQAQIDNILDQINNRKPFSYDYASDPLWHSVSDLYRRNALLGMQSAMGEAAGLTGGYASSYAQQAGQQAYQQEISGMTEIIPELANNALNVWRENNNQLESNLSALQSQQAADYSRYYNDWQLWNTDRNYMYQKVQDMSDDEFNKYITELQRWQADRSFYAEQKQIAIANQQWQAELNENRRQFNNQMLFNYVNMGVGAAVDLTGIGVGAAVDLTRIGVDGALGAASLYEDRRQFDASLAEDQRQFNILHADEIAELSGSSGSGGISTQSVGTTTGTKKNGYSGTGSGSGGSGSGGLSTQSVGSVYGGTGNDVKDNPSAVYELTEGLKYQEGYSDKELAYKNKENLIRHYYENEQISEETANELINKYLK